MAIVNRNMYISMKKIFIIIASAILCLGAVSCNKNIIPEGADTTTLRIAVSPDPGTIPAAGGEFEAVVVVNQGMSQSVAGTLSVDGEPAWVSVSVKDITTHFTGTYAGDDMDVVQKGISCVIAPNLTGKKRSVNLRFTLADGSSIVYPINQSAK